MAKKINPPGVSLSRVNLRSAAALLAGPLLFLVFFLVDIPHIEAGGEKVLAVAALMITWWVTEAIPLPAVALLPIVLFPLLGISGVKETVAGYSDSSIFLFMGGFMLGLAIEKWKLHKRIALNIVRLTGTSGDRIILGFILSTGLMSMWLSNTATTMMMYPIAMSVIQVVGSNARGGNIKNFSLAIMLAIAYAANFGGIATIIGTPPNVAFLNYIEEKYKYQVQFADWFFLCAPIALLLLWTLYLVMTKLMYPNRIASDAATKELIKKEIAALGPMGRSEKRVLAVFSITAGLWITKDLINQLGVVTLNDTMIAIAGGVSLFVFPAVATAEVKSSRLLEWGDTSRMAWGILLLFGGGITLAGGLERAGLIEALGQWIAGFSGSSTLLLVFMIAFISLFISEVMSNIAQVIVFAPVIGGIADALGMSPLLLGVPLTLGASCASMMPMGTPPNAIVFASGHIRFKDMVKTGFVMNIIALVLITLFCWLLVPLLL